MNWPDHGSNPQYLFESLQIPMPEKLIDFSANINPLGPPPKLRENWNELLSYVSDYPDPYGMSLKKKLAQKEEIKENHILIGNGGAEIISLIGRLLAGKDVIIVQPAFSEYETACEINGCHITYHQLHEDDWNLQEEILLRKIKQADAIFLCNPNNPTGVLYPYATIKKLIKECENNHCYLIIDEAFYDFAPRYESIVPLIKDYSRLLIIRSMTKMFAIPGLRLGYLIADEKIIQHLETFKPHWSVNALALKAGEWCLESDDYAAQTVELIEKEKERLFAFYKEAHFAVSRSSVNYYLLKDLERQDQLPFFLFLVEKGIIPRHTMNFSGIKGRWLRFAVKGQADNHKLMEAIQTWREN